MTMQELEARKKRERSPSYPAIDLEDALEKARILYEAERRNAASISVMVEHLGHKSGSGLGAVIIAALKKFGLIVDEGSGNRRKVRLSEEALKIIADERPDSPDRLRLVQC